MEGLAMPAWKVGEVQDITTLSDGDGPGFVLQQEGRSPSLTLVFKDKRTAEHARKKFQEIVDSSMLIVGT
jgi:hypothetical protein